MTRRQNQKVFYVLLGFVSLAVFVFVASLATAKGMSAWEKELLVDVYNSPSSLHWPALIVTQLGSAWMLVGLSIWLLIGRKRAQHKGRVVLVSGLITYFFVESIKQLIARPRPAEIIAGVFQREPLVTGFGFPSGHTALATVISLITIQYLPKNWHWLPLVWIGLVAWSRLHLGVHAPLDVIGGFSLGIVIISIHRLIKIK